MSTIDLYTTKDIQKVREFLLKEQNNLDLLTGLEIPLKQAVTDHRHDDECFVRGIIHRQVNVFVGKTENNFTRMIGWWYPGSISDILRLTADYLELETDKRYRHNSWLKRVKVQFNKLTARQQDQVLVELGSVKGNNLKDRKEKFSKIVLDRSLGYRRIMEVINKVKES